MSTKIEIINYLLDQIKTIPNIRTQKMFGEYALYINQKVVALICDDQIFVKQTNEGIEFARNKYELGHAYPGSKEYLNVTEYLDESDYLTNLLNITYLALPMPKKK